MTATTFIDTNVVLYAASNADADREKRVVARQVYGVRVVNPFATFGRDQV